MAPQSNFSIRSRIKYTSVRIYWAAEISIARIFIVHKTREFRPASFSYIYQETEKAVSANQIPTWAFMKISYRRLLKNHAKGLIAQKPIASAVVVDNWVYLNK